MLNAIKFLVGSSQHVYFLILYKTILLTEKSKCQVYFLEKSFISEVSKITSASQTKFFVALKSLIWHDSIVLEYIFHRNFTN